MDCQGFKGNPIINSYHTPLSREACMPLRILWPRPPSNPSDTSGVGVVACWLVAVLITVIRRQRCSFRAPRQPRKPVTMVTPPATSSRLAAEREGKDSGREENSAWVKDSHTPTPNRPQPPSCMPEEGEGFNFGQS